MKQEYFVVVLAHSLRGRLRRVHIPHKAVYAILALALLGCFSVVGFVASYARMAWKVANYNALKREADALRTRYRSLQSKVNQTDQQLASLELYAREVTVAYNIKQKLEGPEDISGEGKLVPSYAESVEDYDFLRSANSLSLRSRRGLGTFQPEYARPSEWPVEGRLMSPFAQRTDPFSGEGEFHKGVDISAPTGTPVHVTADGIVVHVDVQSGYGKLVIVDHGSGIQTYYAHLSKFFVHTGQTVRRGELVGAVGSTGWVTGPHLHYEVRMGGAPVNPTRYLRPAAPATQQASAHSDFPF
ncbi:MAG TPA: M23 family metallopeptidase [Bryobacteraceae bacterium]|nr:M23 family metallopeptidase [Bryobacteraceae bacterium]